MSGVAIHSYRQAMLITICSEKQEVKNKYEIIHETNFDMSKLRPIKSHFNLSPYQLSLMKVALNTPKGKYVLNELKNKKSSTLINNFLEKVSEKVLPQFKNKLQNLFSQITEAPLIGINNLEDRSIGLTQREIWDALVDAKLIKKN